MEEREKKGIWKSEGKFNQEWAQTFKDFLQLRNRVKILEQEKEKKVKEIQRKITDHRDSVEIKIHKYKKYRDFKNMRSEDLMNMTMHQTSFRAEKQERADKIRKIKGQMMKNKQLEVLSVKQEKKLNQQRIHEFKKAEHQEKVQSRNKVRLMEIQSKQNLTNSWNRQIACLRANRQLLIDQKLKEYKNNILFMKKLQKKERVILKQINEAEQLEREIHETMVAEDSLNLQQLSKLYEASI